MSENDKTEWMVAASNYLNRVGLAEYEQQRKAYKRKTVFRITPSDYIRSLIDCMNRNDEEGFKTIKMLQGYSSSIGV